MHVIRSSACIALACVWSTTASGMSAATTEQMVCVPAVFVVATVTDESPAVSVPEYCNESRHSFCYFTWPLTIKVDRVLAMRPSNISPEETTGFQGGSTLHVKVTARAWRDAPGIAPDDWQGAMSTGYFPGRDATSALRKKKFIFGLVVLADHRSQIWSLSFQGRLQKMLTEFANGQQEQIRCPRL